MGPVISSGLSIGGRIGEYCPIVMGGRSGLEIVLEYDSTRTVDYSDIVDCQSLLLITGSVAPIVRSIRIAIDDETNLDIGLVLERRGDVKRDSSDSVTLISADTIVSAYSWNSSSPILAVVDCTRPGRGNIRPSVVV